MLVVTRPGTIGTLAGTGKPDFAGDGGPAQAANLNEPKNIALDSFGHLYIADSENHVIRRVSLETGMITTVAGCYRLSTAHGFSSAQDRSFPILPDEDPLADLLESTPQRFTQVKDLSGTVRFMVGAAGSEHFSGDGGPAIQATLNFPSAVAVDEQGNLYIADTMNHRVRKVDAKSGVIVTIAGTGRPRYSGDDGPASSAALNEPTDLALDGNGGLYIADQSNHRVRKIDLMSGIITTVAGIGEAAYTGDGIPAREAGLSGPSGLAVDCDGALYIADTFNGRIRKIHPTTGVISTVVGDGGEYRYQGEGAANDFSTSLSRPYGIAIDRNGHILITDSDSHLVRRWHRQKKIITRVAGNGTAGYHGDGGAPIHSSLNYPFGVAVDGQGNIYIADTFNHRIRVIAA